MLLQARKTKEIKMSITGQLTNGVIGMITGKIAQNQTFQNNKNLMGIQASYNKEAAEYSNRLQKEMWDYTNVGNQIKHLKSNGLNPALIYGQTGAGGMGMTGNSNQQGVSIPQDNSVMMGLQAAGIASQIKLNEAKANEANASAGEKEAGKKEKEMNTKAIEKRLAEIDANTEYLKAKKLTEQSQKELNESLKDLNGKTKELTEQQINESLKTQALIEQKTLTEKAITEIKEWDHKLQKETFDDQVAKAMWTVTDLISSVQLKDNQAELTREQAAKCHAELELIAKKAITEDWNAQKLQQEIEKLKNDIFISKWHMTNESIDVILSGASNIINALQPWKGIFGNNKTESKSFPSQHSENYLP